MSSESNLGPYHHSLPSSNGSILSSNQIPIPGPSSHPIGPPPPLLTNNYQPVPPSVTSPTSALLVLSNIPPDLTQREATIIFSLVIDEVINIEIKDYRIFAYFKNINTCMTTGKLIDGKFIFGNDYPPVKVDYDNNPMLNSSPHNLHNTSNTFGNLRLSNSNISPPNLSNHPQIHHQPSNPNIPILNGANQQSQQQGPPPQSQQQQPQQPQQQQQQVPPTPLQQQQQQNQQQGAPPFDNFQKRQSIGNQRSRFVFSDPFATNPGPNPVPPPPQLTQQHSQQQISTSQQSQQSQQQQQSQPQPQSNSQQATPQTQPSNAGPVNSIDLTDLSGKSILLMESQNDAREYENLVRDPWGSASSASGNSGSVSTNQQQQQHQVPPALGSNPQTPGVSSHNTFDWNSSNPNPANSFDNNGGSVSASNGSTINGTANSGGPPGSQSDRRRTSSAFFNTNQPPLLPLTTSHPNPAPPQSQGPQSQSQPPSASTSTNQPVTNSSTVVPQGPTAAGLLAAAQQAQQQQHQQQTQQPSPPSATVPLTMASALSAAVQKSTAPQQQQAPQPTTPHQSASTDKDIPDLSLLARVPPPANPADQNPPCNTLYVGNLPPDATEAELRSLFSPQKGFRRLSFRTKQSTTGPNTAAGSHNHGPMCFVEFEDVAHATRALAELYGRALPRPNGGNGKGGIRLSFSKNPLGVRGPGNPRRTSTNQIPGPVGGNGIPTGQPPIQQQQQPPSQVPQQQGPSSVGNYGYSTYNQK